MKKLMMLSALALLACPCVNVKNAIAVNAEEVSSTYTVFLEDTDSTLGDNPVCYPYTSAVTLTNYYMIGDFSGVASWSYEGTKSLRMVTNNNDKGMLQHIKLTEGDLFRFVEPTKDWQYGFTHIKSQSTDCFEAEGKFNNIKVKKSGWYDFYLNSNSELWISVSTEMATAFDWSNAVTGITQTIDDKKVTAFEIDATKYSKASSYLIFSSSNNLVNANNGFATEELSDTRTLAYSSSNTVSSSSSVYNTITYHFNNGSDNEKVIIKSDNSIDSKDVKKASDKFYDYTLEGWYTDAGYNNKFTFGSAITTDLDLYAKWTYTPTKALADIEKYETKASLSYTYSPTESADSENSTVTNSYDISNVALRFGGVVAKDDYEYFKDEITVFGIFLATDIKEYGTLKAAIDAGKLSECKYQELYYKTTKTDAENGKDPYFDETNYIFNAYISVSEENYDKTVYAIAYLKYGNNGPTITYFGEKSFSVKSIANEYYTNHTGLTDEQVKDKDLMGSLKQLAGIAG